MRFDAQFEALKHVSTAVLPALGPEQLEKLARTHRAVDIAALDNLSAAVVATLVRDQWTAPVVDALAHNVHLCGEALEIVCRRVVRRQDTTALETMVMHGALRGADPVRVQQMVTTMATSVVAGAAISSKELHASLARVALTVFDAPALVTAAVNWPPSMVAEVIAKLALGQHEDPSTPQPSAGSGTDVRAPLIVCLLEGRNPRTQQELLQMVVRRYPGAAGALVPALVTLAGDYPQLQFWAPSCQLSDEQVRALLGTDNGWLEAWARRCVIEPGRRNDPALVAQVLSDPVFVAANAHISQWPDDSDPIKVAYLQAAARYAVPSQPAPQEDLRVGWSDERCQLADRLSDPAQMARWLQEIHDEPADPGVIRVLDDVVGQGAAVSRQKRARWLRETDLLAQAGPGVLDSLGRWAYLPAGNGRRGADPHDLQQLVNRRLGTDERAWAQFFAALPAWAGSLSELVEHALSV